MMRDEILLGVHGGLVWSLVAGAVLLYPLWRIFRRAGLNPWFSLLVFVPFGGGLIVALVLGFSGWPAARRGAPGEPQG
jgi:hypothetical protein